MSSLFREDARIVSDPRDSFHHHYRARVYPSSRGFWWRRPCWRFAIEQHFVSWKLYCTSGPYPTREEAHEAAQRWLSAKERAPEWMDGELVQEPEE